MPAERTSSRDLSFERRQSHDTCIRCELVGRRWLSPLFFIRAQPAAFAYRQRTSERLIESVQATDLPARLATCRWLTGGGNTRHLPVTRPRHFGLEHSAAAAKSRERRPQASNQRTGCHYTADSAPCANMSPEGSSTAWWTADGGKGETQRTKEVSARRTSHALAPLRCLAVCCFSL